MVVIGQALFPSTKGFVHFQFSDYAKLTVIGVVIACVAWPIVTRVSSAPRWLFFRLAIVVTLVLWVPDLYILPKGQPGDAVAILMLMHLAIALVTYNLLVHVAPVRPAAGGAGSRGPGSRASGSRASGSRAAGSRAAGSRAPGSRRAPAAGERDIPPGAEQPSRGQHRHAR